MRVAWWLSHEQHLLDLEPRAEPQLIYRSLAVCCPARGPLCAGRCLCFLAIKAPRQHLRITPASARPRGVHRKCSYHRKQLAAESVTHGTVLHRLRELTHRARPSSVCAEQVLGAAALGASSVPHSASQGGEALLPALRLTQLTLGGVSLHCGMRSGISRLHLLDARSARLAVVTTKNVPRRCQRPHAGCWGRNHPRGSEWFKHALHVSQSSLC